MRVLALILVALAWPGAARAGEWRTYKQYDDGLTLERRAVRGSRFDELRISKRMAIAPKDLADSVWRLRNEGWEYRVHKKRELLRDTPTDRLIYSQLLTPIVSDRDYTVRQYRLSDPATGVFQILFEAANDQGPPPNDDHVRVEVIRGGWTFEPDGDGGTIVTYFFLNDPAGSLPAWIVRGEQRDSAITVFREQMTYAERDRTLAGH
ncbi:MAG: hypothetical protein IT381_19775 [Deltaproteobacteria bacterium]|nr:hypothetical protein [Deltaproteobacteria bacterium]